MIIERVELIVVKDANGVRVYERDCWGHAREIFTPGLTPGRVHATLIEAAGTIPIEDRNK